MCFWVRTPVQTFWQCFIKKKKISGCLSCYCRTERHMQQQTLTSGHQETTILQSYYCRQSSDSQWVKVSKGASNNRNLATLSTIHVSKKFWTSSWAARPCYSSHFHCGRPYLVSNGNISTVKRINLRALWWLVAKNSSPSGSGSLIRWGRQRKFGGGFLFFCF